MEIFVKKKQSICVDSRKRNDREKFDTYTLHLSNKLIVCKKRDTHRVSAPRVAIALNRCDVILVRNFIMPVNYISIAKCQRDNSADSYVCVCALLTFDGSVFVCVCCIFNRDELKSKTNAIFLKI